MYKLEQCPDIKDNFYLGARNFGASRKLAGDIEIIICFMKRKPTDFLNSTQKEFFTELSKACDWLKSEAARYGTRLKFTQRHYIIDIPENSDPDDGYDLIRNFFNSKNISIDQLQARYEQMAGVNEAPFILVFDEEDRSFARTESSKKPRQNEYSVVFKSQYRFTYLWSTIAHELLHQFGAMDFYYPSEIEGYAKRYIKDSIMGIGKENVLDDLTAYLVGIKDVFSEETYLFLQNTMWMNYDLYVKFLNKNWDEYHAEERKRKEKSQQTQQQKSEQQETKQNQILKSQSTQKKKTSNTINQPKFIPIYSEYTGLVTSINVSVGQKVKYGDTIATIGNTTKIVVPSYASGCIDRINVKVGESIREYDLITVINT